MSDFFVRLAERATGKGLTVHPLFASRYSSEPEAQGVSDVSTESVSTESRTGNAESPTKLSMSNAKSRSQPRHGSPDDGLPPDDQERDNQSNPTPTDRINVRPPLLRSSPSIDVEESPVVASTENRQTTFVQDSTREMSSTKPSNLPTERPMVLPAPTAIEPPRRVAMGDVDYQDVDAGLPVHRDPALAAPEHVAFRQDEPLLSPTPTRSNSAEQARATSATIGDLVTQHAMEESVRVGSLEQPPIEPTPQFVLATVPARMDTDRSDVGPPIVRVTIGRIEVRAIMPSVMSERPKPIRAQPVISLDDYLKQGKGAAR